MSENMKKSGIFLSILAVFGICALIVAFIINQNVIFELNGEQEITVNINSVYVDEGITAKIFQNDLNSYVQTKNKVDYSKSGSYSINYYLTYAGKVYMLTRTVNVVDESEVK